MPSVRIRALRSQDASQEFIEENRQQEARYIRAIECFLGFLLEGTARAGTAEALATRR